MISFLLLNKWKAVFNIRQNWLDLLMLFLGLILIMSLALFAGLIYDYALQHMIDAEPSSVIKWVYCFLLLFPVAAKFFPSIALKPVLFRSNYPMTKMKKVFYDLIYAVFSKPWIFFMHFFCGVLFWSSSLVLSQLISSIFFGLCGILFAENLINAFYYTKKYYFMLMAGFLVLTLLLFRMPAVIAFSPVVSAAILPLLIVIYYLFYRPVVYVSADAGNMLSRSKNVFLKIAVRNRRHRQACLFAIAIQVIIALTFMQLIGLSDDFSSASPPSVFIVVSFLMLFSYCYNNIWGFFPSVALSLIISGSKMGSFILVFIKLLLPAVVISAMSFLGYFYFFPEALSWKFLVGFSTLTLFSIAIALIFSFIKMKPVRQAIIFNTHHYNTAPIATYILCIAGLALSLSQKEDSIFYTLVFIILATSIGVVSLLSYRKKIFINELLSKMTTSVWSRNG